MSGKNNNKQDKEKCYSQGNVPCAEPVIVHESQIKKGEYTSDGKPSRCRHPESTGSLWWIP